MHLTSYETLVILITSFGEFSFIILLSFYFSFISLKKINKNKNKKLLQDCFCVALFLLQDSIPSGLEI